MTAPTPEQFAALVDEVLDPMAIKLWRERLKDEYRWLHGAAHESIVRERGKTTGGNVSDPTSGIAVGQVESTDLDNVESDRKNSPQTILRLVLEQAPARIVEVENQLKGLHRSLTRWQGQQGTYGKRGILDPPETLQTVSHRRTASADDLAQAEAAQERRTQRGESIP